MLYFLPDAIIGEDEETLALQGFVSGRAFEIPEGAVKERTHELFKANQMALSVYLGPYYLCQDCGFNTLVWTDGPQYLVGFSDKDPFDGKVKFRNLKRQICPPCQKRMYLAEKDRERMERATHIREKSRLPEHVKKAALAVTGMGERFDEDA